MMHKDKCAGIVSTYFDQHMIKGKSETKQKKF